jgi:glycosyltransferase involved in cell wall biosynthesis
MQDFDKRVLTISSKHNPPKGGLAQIVYNYRKYVFFTFYFVPNGKAERSIYSYTLAILHPFRMIGQFLMHPSIRIVHIHTCSYKGFKHASWTAKLAKLCGKKVVMHMHGGGFKEYYETDKVFVKKQLDKIDAIIALTPSWKDFYSNVVGVKNVYVIPNIVPEPKYIPVEKKNNVFNLLFLGHIHKAKGIFDLVQVLNENHNEYMGKIKLYVGGGMFEEEELKNYVIDNQLEDVVTLCGWVGENDKAKLFSISDAFILPSYIEGQPVSIIEAMSYGLPILSTTVGGIPELVSDGKNGYLFEPGNKGQIKVNIDKLLTNERLRKAMGDKSKKMSEAYMPCVIRIGLEQLYLTLIDKQT